MARRQAAARTTAPRLEVKEFLRRFDKAWERADRWRSLLDDAYRYAMPNRNLFNSTAEGQKKNDVVFDSTAMMAVISAANRIQQDLMPAFKKWVKLKAGPMIPEEMREGLELQLDEVTDRMFAYLHASNFDTAINEVLLDWLVSTGCLLCLPGDTLRPLNYVPVPLAQVALEEGPWGGVSGVYRKHRVAIRNVRGQWPDLKNEPQDWADKLKHDPAAEVDLCEGTYYSIARDGSATTAWYYEVIDKATEKRVVERTYALNPWVTPRAYKLPGEVFGRGPVILALPDIKTLNKVVELLLRNAALAISGVYTGVDDGVLNPNTAQIVPGSIIPVASNGGTRGPSLMELRRSGSFDLQKLEIDELRMTVKRIMFDRQLPPDAGPVRSATEIVERVKELIRDISAPFGRLYNELIVPIVQNTLHIMAARGMVPPIKVDGLGIQVQVISPLAQEQNLAEVEVVVRWLSILASFGTELVMMSAVTEDLGDWLGDKLGVPKKLVRKETERKSIMDDIKQMAANEIAKANGTSVVPIGVGVAPGQVQTAAAAGGVQPFARAA